MKRAIVFLLVLGLICAQASAQSADEWYRRYYEQYEKGPPGKLQDEKPRYERASSYLVFHGGGAFPTNGGVAEARPDAAQFDFDLGWDAGAAGGVGGGFYLRPLRLELDSTVLCVEAHERADTGSPFYTGSSDRDRNILAIPVTANLYCDVPLTQDKAIQLYFGGGVGIAGVLSSGDDDWVFAYQFGTGLSFRLAERFALIVGYRLLSTSQIEVAGAKYDAPLVHLAEVGLRLDL